MTGTAARIRWEPGTETEITAWFGHAGIVGFSLFQILHPVFRGEEHTLASNLPGQQQRRLDGDPEALKAEAERWLEEFIISLGAVFTDTFRAAVQAERDMCREIAEQREIEGRELQAERLYKYSDGLERALDLMDTPAQSPETAALQAAEE